MATVYATLLCFIVAVEVTLLIFAIRSKNHYTKIRYYRYIVYFSLATMTLFLIDILFT